MRIVIDANVYISSLISSKGTPAIVVNRWLEGSYEVLISQAIIDEILRVMAYERLQKYRGVRDARTEFVTLLSEQALWVEPTDVLAVVPEDETDNRYIECAVSGNASYIVTGDSHLLNLGEYQGIQLVAPSEFLALMDSELL